jgi:hypothetical protein
MVKLSREAAFLIGQLQHLYTMMQFHSTSQNLCHKVVVCESVIREGHVQPVKVRTIRPKYRCTFLLV